MKKIYAVITVQGTITKIPCFNEDELNYYSGFLRIRKRVFTIHYFKNSDEVSYFMERG